MLALPASHEARTMHGFCTHKDVAALLRLPRLSRARIALLRLPRVAALLRLPRVSRDLELGVFVLDLYV